MPKCDLKLLCNFIETSLQHGYSPVNLLHIFRTPFYKNTYGGLFLFRQSARVNFFPLQSNLQNFFGH